jgi:hypothetical protein
MVLGVDDFEQQHAYLAGRDKAIVRDLIGYGTFEGLNVSLDDSDAVNGVQVMVSKGSAVNPQGQLIRVKDDQCAFINQWLAAQKTRLIKEHYDAVEGDAVKVVPVYVKLCYRECLTDSVPLPDQPCRSEDAALVPSRISDDYELMLDFDPPDQREEDELRHFIAWLNTLPVQDGGAGSITNIEDFSALVLAHLPKDADPDRPGVQPPSGTMPDTTNVRLPLAALPEYLRVAFRLWVTALRPNRLGRGQDAAGKPPVEECVLLACLNLPLQDNTGGSTPGPEDRGSFSVSPSQPVKIDESRRPYVLHLRAIQEQLLYAQARLQVPLDGDVTGALDANEVQQLKRVPIAYTQETPPTDGQVLVARPTEDGGVQWTPEMPTAGVPASAVVSETTFGQSAAVGESTEYARADHTHGTPALPDLEGDVTGSITTNTVSALKGIPVAYDSAAVTSGQVLTLEPVPGQPRARNPRLQWAARTPETGGGTIADLSGDVSGDPTANRLENIQGVPVKVDREGLRPYSILRYNGEAFVNVLYAPIVASGFVVPTRDLGESQPLATFGDLRLALSDEGLLATFATYINPNDQQWSYVVKALPAMFDQDNFPIVAFGDFTDEGFTLFVRNVMNNEAMSGEALLQMRFMIEVTQVGINPEFI